MVDAPAALKAVSSPGGKDGAVVQNGAEAAGGDAAGDAEEAPKLIFGKIWQYQKPVAEVYTHTYCEVSVACLIGANFITNLVTATIDPVGDKYKGVWFGFEVFYNMIFAVELAVNMYAFWCKAFWSSAWNVFDFVVVSIGLLLMTPLQLPEPLKMLRMMRAFRVFRLFKRIKSLKKIMENLARAMPGVMNAFVILVLVMCIYAILGVEFWLEYGAGGYITNESGYAVPFQTARNQDYGHEYFGNFPKSLYTMFQVMTTESWCEAVARPLINIPDSFAAVGVSLFFVSFSILCGIILVNVAVTALLEKFCEKEEDKDMNIDDAEVEESLDDLESLRGDLGELKDQLQRVLKFIQAQQEFSNFSTLPPVGISMVPPPASA